MHSLQNKWQPGTTDVTKAFAHLYLNFSLQTSEKLLILVTSIAVEGETDFAILSSTSESSPMKDADHIDDPYRFRVLLLLICGLSLGKINFGNEITQPD